MQDYMKGLCNLNTRRRGKVFEIATSKQLGFTVSKSVYHDLLHKKNRIEVKSSVVMKKHKSSLNEDNVLQCIKEAAQQECRMIPFSNRTAHAWDCNIEQVKPTEFDTLYYWLAFSDAFLLFRIDSKSVSEVAGYCDKQHKGGSGEGQFHITNKNIDYHIANYLVTKQDDNEFFEGLK